MTCVARSGESIAWVSGVIGENDGGFIVTKIFDEQLPELTSCQCHFPFDVLGTVEFLPGTSSSTLRQADAGNPSTSVSNVAWRRRNVMNGIFISVDLAPGRRM